MASTNCGWCGTASHMTPITAFSGPLPRGGNITQVAYSCDNCKRFSVAWADGKSTHGSDRETNDTYLTNDEDTSWSPRVGDAVMYDDVPAHIASAASEAHECQSIGAKRAAILMARSVIEASAKAHLITEGSLYKKIDSLAKKGIIRPLIAEAAHGIRDFGNDMAHGDFEVEVTDDDVNETLNLMAVVLSEVFQVDAKTKSLRERYAQRQADRKASGVDSQISN